MYSSPKQKNVTQLVCDVVMIAVWAVALIFCTVILFGSVHAATLRSEPHQLVFLKPEVKPIGVFETKKSCKAAGDVIKRKNKGSDFVCLRVT